MAFVWRKPLKKNAQNICLKTHTHKYFWVSTGAYIVYQLFLFVDSTIIYSVVYEPTLNKEWVESMYRKCENFELKPNKMFTRNAFANINAASCISIAYLALLIDAKLLKGTHN